MLDCTDIRELLANSIDCELTEAMQERVDRHLADCSACMSEAQRLRATVDAAQSTSRPESVGSWFAERTLSRILDEFGSNGNLSEETTVSSDQLGFWDERNAARP